MYIGNRIPVKSERSPCLLQVAGARPWNSLAGRRQRRSIMQFEAGKSQSWWKSILGVANKTNTVLVVDALWTEQICPGYPGQREVRGGIWCSACCAAIFWQWCFRFLWEFITFLLSGSGVGLGWLLSSALRSGCRTQAWPNSISWIGCEMSLHGTKRMWLGAFAGTLFK